MNKYEQMVELVWDSLKRDPEYKDRRQTAWSTKTKVGLAACFKRLAEEPNDDRFLF